MQMLKQPQLRHASSVITVANLGNIKKHGAGMSKVDVAKTASPDLDGLFKYPLLKIRKYF